MKLGTKVPLTEFPEDLQRTLYKTCDDDQMVDIVFATRQILESDVGGISL